MSITYQKITEDRIEDFALICKWDNDDEIKHFLIPNFKESALEDTTVDELIERFKANTNKAIYIILCDDVKIGYVSIQTNFDFLYKKEEGSAWISICVGEKEYRGKGIGELAMQFLEDKAKEMHCSRIELGVFEYNLNARLFYEKLGYTPIGENKDFAYYNGQWYNDIRMEKKILQSQ